MIITIYISNIVSVDESILSFIDLREFVVIAVPINDRNLRKTITDTVWILFFDSPVRIAGATSLIDDYETRGTSTTTRFPTIKFCGVVWAEGISTEQLIYGDKIEKKNARITRRIEDTVWKEEENKQRRKTEKILREGDDKSAEKITAVNQ